MQPDARQRGLQEDMCSRLGAIGPAESEAFCADKWELVRSTGILGLPFDAAYGGRGEDLITTMHVLEELGRGCDDGGLTFSVTTQLVSAGIPLARAGSDALKARYLPRLVSGSAIGAHAITEPSGGSDALAMGTRAVRDGDHYVLDGTKAFITHAPVAEVFVIYAKTRPEGGPLGITAFVVDRDTPGLHTGSPIGKLGLKGSPVGELVLEGCRVPAGNIIGRPGAGFFVLDHVMKWEILLSFVTSVGAMGRRLARCIEHARGREQFGRPLGAFQAVSHKVVDMKIAVETSRRWLFDAAAKLLAGQDASTEIAIAKLVTSEANVKTALDAVQIFGASGYATSGGLEAGLRDAVGGTIYSGTSEIQRNRIAATLGLR
jgi:alkylation response protein AidB-like acyl-CoA dehydrogenase